MQFVEGKSKTAHTHRTNPGRVESARPNGVQTRCRCNIEEPSPFAEDIQIRIGVEGIEKEEDEPKYKESIKDELSESKEIEISASRKTIVVKFDSENIPEYEAVVEAIEDAGLKARKLKGKYSSRLSP